MKRIIKPIQPIRPMKKKQPLPLLHVIMITVAFSLLSPIAYADWGVGLEIDNEKMQYENNNDVNLTALFNIQYQGDKFNIGERAITYKVIDTKHYTVEALATSKHRGFDGNDTDNKTLKGMDKRDDSIDLGGRVIIETESLGAVVVDITKDVEASKGIDAGIKVGGIHPHTPHWTGKKHVNIAAVAGVKYQSDKVVNHYFGVKNNEATANRKAYTGTSATTPFIGFEAQANLTPHINIDGYLGIDKTAKSVKNSSITDDKDYALAATIGFTYWF